MSIGEYIRNHREKLGLLQKDVAYACDVSITAVSLWESGKTENMRIDRVIPLCRCLHMNVADFLNQIDSEQNTSDENCLIDNYRALSEEGQKRLMEYSEMLYPMYGRKSVSE